MFELYFSKIKEIKTFNLLTLKIKQQKPFIIKYNHLDFMILYFLLCEIRMNTFQNYCKVRI